MSAYSDALGTASLSYDELSRLTSQTDSNGNQVQYEYDALGRVTKLTPAQGSSYRIEYQYKKNGALSKAKVYDAGASADTDYTYDTTSGLLTQRNFPAALGNNIRTTYAYDAAGRLEYETQTRQAAGTTNLYKTQYAYSYIAAASGGGRQLVRSEQSYSGGAWVNDNKLTYQHDALGRQNYEERHDWAAGAWSTRYDTTQAYDKNGNRTGYDHNVAGGYTTSYGRAANLSYTFNALNQLTALTDSDDANYNATVSCDANNNITSVTETYSTTAFPPVIQSTLATDFTYDALNRMTEHKTTRYDLGAGKTHYTLRDHTIDALGRVAKSSYSAYYQGDMPGVSSLEHVYAGASHVQNYDGASAYGAVWHWAGSSSGAGGSARHSHGSPLNSPNPDTASQKGYNIAAMGGKNTPQRRSWTSPASEGNKREIYGQGRPQAKDSSGNGANWYVGTISNPAGGGSNVESRFFYEGTVSATDMSRATDAREASRIGIFGTSNSYGGSYGRVTNEALGRDINPLGRGDGVAYVAGSMEVGRIAPILPMAAVSFGAGNSVNNPGCVGGGGGGGSASGGGGGASGGDNLTDEERACMQKWLDERRTYVGQGCCVRVCLNCPCKGLCTGSEYETNQAECLRKLCACANTAGCGNCPCGGSYQCGKQAGDEDQAGVCCPQRCCNSGCGSTGSASSGGWSRAKGCCCGGCSSRSDSPCNGICDKMMAGLQKMYDMYKIDNIMLVLAAIALGLILGGPIGAIIALILGLILWGLAIALSYYGEMYTAQMRDCYKCVGECLRNTYGSNTGLWDEMGWDVGPGGFGLLPGKWGRWGGLGGSGSGIKTPTNPWEDWHDPTFPSSPPNTPGVPSNPGGGGVPWHPSPGGPWNPPVI